MKKKADQPQDNQIQLQGKITKKGEIKMTRVNVINGNKGETVIATEVRPTGQAEPTNRILEPYLAAEYQEPAVMPDGRECLKIYQFDEDEIKEAQADGNDAWEEDLPWNEEHIDHVVIYD